MFVIVYIIEIYFGIGAWILILLMLLFFHSLLNSSVHDLLLTLEIPFHHSIYQSRKISGWELFAKIEGILVGIRLFW